MSLRPASVLFLLSLCAPPLAISQPGSLPQVKSPATPVASTEPVDYSSESYVIQKYSTDIAYAADGTGERLITVQAKVQSDAAVRQFGVLEFSYESRNEHVDFVYVRVRKPDGSVVATPDAEAQDQPAEVTRQAPFYSDIRVKQLPVKSLSVGDQLEYQVRQVRTVAASPGQFWYAQSFVTNAVVLEETASLDVPKGKYVQVESDTGQPMISESGDRKTYRWKTSQLEKTKLPDEKAKKPVIVEQPPSIAVTTFKSWEEVGRWYGDLQKERVAVTPAVQAKADELTKFIPAGPSADLDKIAALYTYVATQYRYIGVAFGVGRYQPHSADDVMQNQYGDCKDKHTLLAALLKAKGYDAWPVLVGSQHVLQPKVPSPGQFDHVITAVTLNQRTLWMDSTPEVAPFQLLFSGLRDKQVLGIPNGSTPGIMKTPANPPFEAFDKIDAKGTLAADGTMNAHLDVTLRGDDELLYRIGFHQTPRMQWQTLVQNISYSIGFGGTVSNVNGGIPEKTAEPFQYSYDYTRKDYADWPNRRILALIPPFSFAYGQDDGKPVDTILLGGPTTYSFRSTIQMPSSYAAELPSPVSLKTDFAEYSATYSQTNGGLLVERSLKFKQREIPVARWDDYLKFEKTVQDDGGQFIQLLGVGGKVADGQPASDADAPALMRQAVSDTLSRNYGDAQSKLEKAEKLSPTQLGLWATYAFLDVRQNKRDEAIKDFQKELKAHPENFTVYQSLAGLLIAADRNDEAIATLRALLQADPGNAKGHTQLAYLLIANKRFAEAAIVLDEAVVQSPDNTGLRVMLGNAEISSGKIDKGTEMLRGVLARASDAEILNEAAYILADANLELPLARASCEKALKALDEETAKTSLKSLTDDDLKQVLSLAATWDTMAWILFRQGEFDSAAQYAKASWMLDQRAAIGFHLGQIYEKQGKTQDAIEAYRMAVAAGTEQDKTGVADASDRLKALASADVNKTLLGEKLGAERSIKLLLQTKIKGSADFFVQFSPNQVDDAVFLQGDEFLKPLAASLKLATYQVPFPAGSGAKIVRRGILYCSQALKECQFTMLTPESAKRN